MDLLVLEVLDLGSMVTGLPEPWFRPESAIWSIGHVDHLKLEGSRQLAPLIS